MRTAITRLIFLVTILTGWIFQASAHEFWITPKNYRPQPDEPITATLRVGRMMRGTEIPYLSENINSATVTSRSGVRNISGQEGDTPALSTTAEEAGLHVITYNSTGSQSNFDTWEKFEAYLTHEGLHGIAEAHRARGLPEKNFKEVYYRHAKSLLQVGAVDGQDRDTAQNLPLEIVVGENPYKPGLKALRVTLLHDGAPAPGRQVSVFQFDGQVSRTIVKTDERGSAEIPLAGGGTFLLNAVVMQPLENNEEVWASHWASLSFGLPVVLPDLHPLDPLARVEMIRAIRAIGKSGRANKNTRIALVTRAEPDKTAVLAWNPGDRTERKAFVVVRNGPNVFEALVNIANGKLERWEHIPGVQPPIDSLEWKKAQQLTKQDPRWIKAMQSRGYDDVSNIFCESLSAGYFGRPEERERRLLKMPCYDIRGAKTNIYGRPIEGLISVVDLDKGKVLRVIDTGAIPISADDHGFDEASQGTLNSPLKPVRNHAPSGWNFVVDKRFVSWQGWSFHLGFDQRFGAVVSLVRHADGPSQRMILYQGHLSEVFVPYMDAAVGWYYRAYLDAGEYGLGALSSPLAEGLDCPDGALVFDADLVTPIGAAYKRRRVLCVFERDTTAPLWRHWEALNGAYEGRPATELVVRSIPSIGNYDYIVDWVFTQKGEIRVDLGATGIDAVKGVSVKTMKDPGAAQATQSGMLVAPNLVAVHHDHYFSFRLDIDVDDPINSFVRERIVPATLPKQVARRSIWRLERVPMTTEGALSAQKGPELWRIENPGRETALGHRPSYQIAGGKSARSLLHPDDWPQRRAAFSAQTLWITSRKPGERFAGGRYPNQSPGGAGLSDYVDGESIVEGDIVAWYTIGFHHLTRPEDWPVLPTVWHGFRLRPYSFFSKNPGIGVRQNFADDEDR